MFDGLKKIIGSMKNVFSGVAADPPRSPYGEYYYKPSPFANFGEQVIFFATSGSSGYMKDGIYRDISGARITEDEFREIIRQSGMDVYMKPGTLEKMWRGEPVELETGENK